jgi:hypothetical protein
MKTKKTGRIMKNEQTRKQLETFRFRISKGEKQQDGKIEKKDQAGVATLLEGQNNYTIYIYMLQNDQFFLVPHKENPEKYFIMTRRPNRNPRKRTMYEWNVVGKGKANARQGCIELYFDLFSVPLYMSIYPTEKRIAHELKLAA